MKIKLKKVLDEDNLECLIFNKFKLIQFKYINLLFLIKKYFLLILLIKKLKI